MSLLDLQIMDTEAEHTEDLHGGGLGSNLSLLSCVSAVSTALCL